MDLAYNGRTYATRQSRLALFVVGTAISLLVVVPAAYLFWRFGAFGGADAKALIVLAVLFPTFPLYQVGGALFPLHATPTGAFALAILSNTVLVGACYPLWLALHNAAAGRFTPLMAVGRPVDCAELSRAHGRLLEPRSGFPRAGLDLDALRMYLRWRGATLADLRDDPDRHRRPDSLPADPLPAGDGMVAPGDEPRTASRLRSDGAGRTARRNPNAERPRSDDDWGADAFLADVGTAYGTTPEGLREGLELLVARDRVWVSPGIPFLVPILIGLLIGLIYGDPLIAALVASGLA